MNFRLPDQNLATLISEAAFDPTKWAQVCDGMASLIGGCGSVMFPFGPDQAKLGLPHSDSLEESFEIYVKDEWYKRDLRFSALERCRNHGYVTDADYISYDDTNHSDYYQDFLKPVKLRWFAGLGIGEGADYWIFSIQQSLGKNPFSKSDIRRVFAYRQIINNSAMISRQLGFERIVGAADVMEHHGRAVIVLGFDGRVLHMSASALKQIGKAFQVVQGTIRPRYEKDRLPMERLIASFCNIRILNASSHPIPLSRGPELPPLVVYGIAFPERERQTFSGATAMLVIIDPDADLTISAHLLIDYYDITHAEAKLAISLIKGISIEIHSVENSISPVTARNHLQNLLRKTRTHSKAELVAVLGKIVPQK